MFHYTLNNIPDININEQIIKNIFQTIEKNIDISQNGILNIVFLEDDEIQELNKTHRGIDKSTDVLSFHYFDDFSQLSKEETAGEIILSEKKVISQSIEYGLGTEGEFYKLLIHSILHILGFDHEEDHDYKIMQEKENLIWKEVFEK
ncbi:MAG: rRNA maturation RNase YbeY [Candidatus Gracilibacteria bacterium]|nr:rRNA maturation RNase YbeY [Candidatus Gracilibacteria bacterium]